MKIPPFASFQSVQKYSSNPKMLTSETLAPAKFISLNLSHKFFPCERVRCICKNGLFKNNAKLSDFKMIFQLIRFKPQELMSMPNIVP